MPYNFNPHFSKRWSKWQNLAWQMINSAMECHCSKCMFNVAIFTGETCCQANECQGITEIPLLQRYYFEPGDTRGILSPGFWGEKGQVHPSQVWTIIIISVNTSECLERKLLKADHQNFPLHLLGSLLGSYATVSHPGCDSMVDFSHIDDSWLGSFLLFLCLSLLHCRLYAYTSGDYNHSQSMSVEGQLEKLASTLEERVRESLELHAYAVQCIVKIYIYSDCTPIPNNHCKSLYFFLSYFAFFLFS